jgi:hypothetical protein
MDEHSAEASSVASLAAASASGSLPPLPEPLSVLKGLGYTAAQMRQYAASCLEEAAKVCEARAGRFNDDEGHALRAAATDIRALKP